MNMISRPSTRSTSPCTMLVDMVELLLSLGTAEMRQQQHLGPGIGQFEDRRRDRLGPGQVGCPPVLHRQVEIDANQRDLAAHVAEIVESLEAGHSYSPFALTMWQSAARTCLGTNGR